MSRIAYIALGMVIGGWLTRPRKATVTQTFRSATTGATQTLALVADAVRRGGAFSRTLRP